MRGRRLLSHAVLSAAVLVLAACGGNDSRTNPYNAPPHGASDGGMQHIHGLGVLGDTLYIATHHGLWIARAGQTTPRRLGESRQDVMGFSIVGPDRFVGSGHPHPSQDDLPPNLGLIASRDGGKSWTNISLLGKADFHALQSAGRHVYGFDGIHGRLMASADGGRTWQQRTPPAGIYSLAIDPTSPRTIIASTEKGLFASHDAGKTLRPLELREQRAGLLAWATRDRLYLVDGDGAVQRSTDRGSTWQPVGSIDGQPAAFIAHDHDLYAALTDATVKRSGDGGRSWTIRATP